MWIFGHKLKFSYVLIQLISKCDLSNQIKERLFAAMMNTDYHISCGRNLKSITMSHFYNLPHTFYAVTKWLVIIAVGKWPYLL